MPEFIRRLIALALAVTLSLPSGAVIAPETVKVEVLPSHVGKGWFWVWGNNAPSMSASRAHLLGSNGTYLGHVPTGFFGAGMLPSASRSEIFSAETYFSRGVRGERRDVITVYDPNTLRPKREIAIPPKRMTTFENTGLFVMSDDERFAYVMNYTPAQSVSIVDLAASQFVAEVETPGCATIVPAGKRDFYSICGDGGLLHVRLDEGGKVVLKQRVAPLFDPVDDFLTTVPARLGSTWYFISKQNNVYALSLTADGARLVEKWSLLSDKERKDNWRYSGVVHSAVHQKSGRLYTLMHEGGPETAKQPGTEVWVYDVKTHQRLSRIDMNEQTLSIAVSQDDTPRLYALDFIVPLPKLFTLWIYLTQGEAGVIKQLRQEVNIYDAGNGKHLQRVGDLPYGYMTNIQPW